MRRCNKTVSKHCLHSLESQRASLTSILSKIPPKLILLGLMILLFAAPAMAENSICLKFDTKGDVFYHFYQLEDRPEGIAFCSQISFSQLMTDRIENSKILYFDNESIGLINPKIEKGDDAIKEFIINNDSFTIIYENGKKEINEITTNDFKKKFSEMRNHLIQKYGYKTRANASKMQREKARYINEMSEDEIREALGMGKKKPTSSAAASSSQNKNTASKTTASPAKTILPKPTATTGTVSRNLTPQQFITNRLGLIDCTSGNRESILSALARNGIQMSCTSGNEQIMRSYASVNPGFLLAGENISSYTILTHSGEVHTCQANIIKRGWTKAEATAYAKKIISSLESVGYKFRDIAKVINAEYAMSCDITGPKYYANIAVFPLKQNGKTVSYYVYVRKFRSGGL